jgi:gas vesicle protein
MKADTHDRRDHGFVIGLVTGTFVGAGLALWLAPRMATEIRERITASVQDLGNRASDRCEQVAARAGETVDKLARTGESLRSGVADAVVHGAREVARQAAAMKTGG